MAASDYESQVALCLASEVTDTEAADVVAAAGCHKDSVVVEETDWTRVLELRVLKEAFVELDVFLPELSHDPDFVSLPYFG